MTDQRVTIRQLARLSGVSIGTVSRALNGYSDVNPDTRERIVRLAQELDYTPAAAARSLVTQRSHLIGVFLETGEGHPDPFGNPFFYEVLVGLKNAIGAGGYDLLLFASERPGNGYGDHSFLKRARHHNVAGVVLMDVAPEDPEVRRLVRSDLPCVGVDVELVGPATEFVISDNKSGIALAMRHLHELGHRRIATITGLLDTAPGAERLRALPRARCRPSGWPTATSTSPTEISTSTAGTGRWRACSRCPSRRPRSSRPPTSWRWARFAPSPRPGAACRATCRSSASTTSNLPATSIRRSPRCARTRPAWGPRPDARSWR